MGMKVLMIGAYPLEPGLVHGGIESVTSTLVPALAERDDIDSVTVLRFHDGNASTDYRREGPKVDVHYMRGQRGLRTVTGSFLDVRKARELVAELKPDVVHGQEIGLYGDIVTKLSRNCVVTTHGLPHVEMRKAAQRSLREKLRAKPMEKLMRRVLRRAKVVISISSYDARELDGMVEGTWVSIANPTAAEFFSLAPSGPTERRVLFAGVLTPRKKPEGLIDAFAKLHKSDPVARLVMVGPQPDPDYAETIRARITRLGLDDNVDIVGLVDNQRLREEIAASRMVVLFSREETAPTIIAQAMAAGKPVVASDVGGVAEMVGDGETGFVVAPGDVAALALRMLTLLDDQELSQRMGKRGHEIALKRFAPEAVARATADAYRAALT
jgi:glycosyltransferase involved in cell wall biosynthesis